MARAVRQAILAAFAPERAIGDPSMFSGREAEIETLAESLHDAGSIPIVYGDRGVGKTSLSLQHELIAQGDSQLLDRYGLADLALPRGRAFRVVRMEGSRVQGAESIERRLIQEMRTRLGAQEVHSKFRVSKRSFKLGFDAKPLTGEVSTEYTPNDTPVDAPFEEWQEFYWSRTKRNILAIIDEFDQVKEKDDVARWAHSLSPDGVRLSIYGIARDYHELLHAHPSLDRALRPVALKPMSREELIEILDRATLALGAEGIILRPEPRTALLLAEYSGGYPWYMQYLGRTAYLNAMDRNSNRVGEVDLEVARRTLATDRWGEKFERTYLRIADRGPDVEAVLRFIARNSDTTWASVSVESVADFCKSLDPSIRVHDVIGVLRRTGVVRVEDPWADGAEAVAFQDPTFRIFCLSRPPKSLARHVSPALGGSVEARYSHRAIEASVRELPNPTATPGTNGSSLIWVGAMGGSRFHIGHARVLATADAHARYLRSIGMDVRFPAFVWSEGGAHSDGPAQPMNGDPGLNHVRETAARLNTLADWALAKAVNSGDCARFAQSFFLDAVKAGLAIQRVRVTAEGRPIRDWILAPAGPAGLHSDLADRMRGRSGDIRRIIDSAQHLFSEGLSLTTSSDDSIPVPIHVCQQCQAILPWATTQNGTDISYPCGSCGAPAVWIRQYLSPRMAEVLAFLNLPIGTEGAPGVWPMRKWVPGTQSLMDDYLTQWFWACYFVIERACVELGYLRTDDVVLRVRIGSVGGFTGGVPLSKSLGPDLSVNNLLNEYGSDALRLALVWETKAGQYIDGESFRLDSAAAFLERVWRVGNLPQATSVTNDAAPGQLREWVAATTMAMHQMAPHLTRGPLSQLLKYCMSSEGTSAATDLLLQLLAPLAPGVTATLWDRRYPGRAMSEEPWPRVDEWPEVKRSDRPTHVTVAIDGRRVGRLSLDGSRESPSARELASRSFAEVRDLESLGQVQRVVEAARTINYVTRAAHEARQAKRVNRSPANRQSTGEG